jgi:tRNA A-37 threonylcarbamoyl transferase component Bud32
MKESPSPTDPGRRPVSIVGTGSRTLPLQIAGYRGVFDPRFAEGESMPRFVREVDALMGQGQFLKNDRASFVSRVRWNGQEVVVKRYNRRGFWHSLRHTIKGSRAKRTWLHAHRLVSLGVATPEPLAYFDEYRGRLLRRSYFVTRFVPGPHVYQMLRDPTVADEQKQGIHDQILDLLSRLAEHGISHGDMKHTNILFDGTGVVLTDLDAMRIGGARWLRRRRYRRDLERYRRDLAGLGMTSNVSQDGG